MTDTAVLTGQDIGEAEGAMTALLERVLAGTGRSRAEYITLRLLAARPAYESAAELAGSLAGQRQLGLDHAGAMAMLDRMRAEALVTAAPVELTEAGRSTLDELTAAIAPVTREVFAGFDRDDLAVAHRVLARLIERARTMVAAA